MEEMTFCLYRKNKCLVTFINTYAYVYLYTFMNIYSYFL